MTCPCTLTHDADEAMHVFTMFVREDREKPCGRDHADRAQVISDHRNCRNFGCLRSLYRVLLIDSGADARPVAIDEC